MSNIIVEWNPWTDRFSIVELNSLQVNQENFEEIKKAIDEHCAITEIDYSDDIWEFIIGYNIFLEEYRVIDSTKNNPV